MYTWHIYFKISFNVCYSNMHDIEWITVKCNLLHNLFHNCFFALYLMHFITYCPSIGFHLYNFFLLRSHFLVFAFHNIRFLHFWFICTKLIFLINLIFTIYFSNQFKLNYYFYMKFSYKFYTIYKFLYNLLFRSLGQFCHLR